MTLTEEQKALFDALTQLQRRFVTALLEGANQTEAYRRAGGKAKGDGEVRQSHPLPIRGCPVRRNSISLFCGWSFSWRDNSLMWDTSILQ
ncbi:hypothetical protein [Yersinia similis]|uniref:Terminase small subunit n=1 Tax=Yersinia similis TaxID=367190 RepID=A0A0T9RHY1_9GAMM|nr:hypothetical protein [Yersinia similis]AHK19759.1 terminase small subunit [Yersinia similis]CNC66654.1 phage terminase small subunit [Yersinia similis]CNG43493.1 phage terminase small subunit [Yersinia similis]CNI62010.1 phage terminase small subunit [Yersinia similis]